MKKIIWNKLLAIGLVIVSLAICAAAFVLTGLLAGVIVKLFLFGFNLI